MSNANIVAAIRVMGMFTNNSSTLVGTTEFCGWGDLPDAYRTDVIQGTACIVYWLYSYDTPIAWVSEDLTVTMPPFGYSPITTTHQEMTAKALGINFHVQESIRVGSRTAGPGVECDSARSPVRRRRGLRTVS